MGIQSDMSKGAFDPLVRPRPDGLQLSYQFPHRVYDSKVYPIQSPNGSTVIIYGHDFGIRILWRGGKNFKKQKTQQDGTEAKAPVNGVDNNDSIMVIDSDDEEPAPTPQPEIALPEFEDDEEEIDPSRPFENIIQYLDVKLDTKVFGIAVPSILPGAARFLSSISPILSNMIVVTAVCSDSSVRIVSVPLIPPPLGTVDAEFWKPQIISIGEGSVQGLPATAALTFTRQTLTDEDGNRRSQSRGRAMQDTPPSAGNWEILVAIHTSDLSGKLSIYRIPFYGETAQGKLYSLSTEPQFPIRQQFLKSPASSISFSPCQYPSERHSQLLLSLTNGSVKVYSCLSTPQASNLDRKRSGTNAETVDATGRWLVTLYTDFDPVPGEVPRRKGIVDAKWALGGKGVFALLSNGEWGVWDIDSSQGDSAHQGRSTSSLSSFAIAGRMGPSERTVRSQGHADTSEAKPTQFAPLTPSTRRIREEALFKGAPNSATQHATRGSICIIPSNQTWDQPADESVLLWHGTRNAYIPSLAGLRRNYGKQGLFGNNQAGPKPTLIEHINLLGEVQKGIQFLSLPTPANQFNLTPIPTILITAERRLIILAENLLESAEAKQKAQQQGNAPVVKEDDQTMLQRGELDITGMGRVLAGMAASSEASFGRGMQTSSLFS
ncbi:nucleoporin [Trichophyton mentagrophytes]|uniref:Nucleoporin NUP37 n=1 Tax=Trichophyton interdigitale (strain MR816) TaxID=1215338 RepID=A0A059IZW7_TRIIM|nr:hypothetical protein H101_00532 [Trichophyton interdigitale H6]KDB21156.1 hypothetical protein H109_06923 [Trichophyton interdigitale MR816]GBF65766.1 nucleoporin [Trichophyton mentagrophytes]